MVLAAKGICFLAVCICLLQMLTDGTRLKAQAAFVYKLVFAAVLAGTVLKLCSGFELPEITQYEAGDYSSAAEVYRTELERKAGENISDVLYSQLRAAGIDIENITAEVNISEDGSIDISKVIISSSDPLAAAELICRSLGQETEVINGTDR